MSAVTTRADQLGPEKMGEPMGELFVKATDKNGVEHTITIAQYYNALVISPDENAYVVPEGTIANKFLAAPW